MTCAALPPGGEMAPPPPVKWRPGCCEGVGTSAAPGAPRPLSPGRRHPGQQGCDRGECPPHSPVSREGVWASTAAEAPAPPPPASGERRDGGRRFLRPSLPGAALPGERENPSGGSCWAYPTQGSEPDLSRPRCFSVLGSPWCWR